MGSLSAAQRAKIRRLSQPKELSPDEEGGELNIVPFLDIIVNILIFVLATVAVTFTSTIETTPPAGKGSGVRASTPEDTLSLTVFIVNNGYSVKASGGNVAPNCAGVGPGITIPKRNGEYDTRGLAECAAKLKRSNPDFSDEDQFFISANPGIPYHSVIEAVDALRDMPDGAGALFPNVNFKVAQ